MKSGALVTALGVIGCAGYFGYDYWHDRKVQQQRDAEQAQTQRDLAATKRAHESGSAAPDAPVTTDSTGSSNTPTEGEGSAAHGPWTLPVPDLTGLTVAKAKEAWVKAGFDAAKFSILENSACHYDNDKDMLPKGVVCSQAPLPPADIPPHSPISVAVENDDYQAGQVGTAMEWRRMPALVGMTEREAKSTLATKGFTTDAFEFAYKSGCGRRGTVCSTHPDAEGRVVKARQGTVWVSQ